MARFLVTVRGVFANHIFLTLFANSEACGGFLNLTKLGNKMTS